MKGYVAMSVQSAKAAEYGVIYGKIVCIGSIGIFLVPLFGLQTCIVPVLSYNFAIRSYKRCRQTMKTSIVFSIIFMLIGVACFEIIPGPLLSIFSKEAEVFQIGIPAFRIIGISFLPAVLSLLTPVFFQTIGASKESVALSLLRQIICLVPIFWLLSKLGLTYTWFAFPAAEIITGCAGMILYYRKMKKCEAEKSIS